MKPVKKLCDPVSGELTDDALEPLAAGATPKLMQSCATGTHVTDARDTDPADTYAGTPLYRISHPKGSP